MEKVVSLPWGDPALLRAGARAVAVNVHDTAAGEAPSPVATPEGEEPHCAEVSVWVDSYDRRQPVERAVVAPGLRGAAYLVVESLYEDCGTTPHGGATSATRWSGP